MISSNPPTCDTCNDTGLIPGDVAGTFVPCGGCVQHLFDQWGPAQLPEWTSPIWQTLGVLA